MPGVLALVFVALVSCASCHAAAPSAAGPSANVMGGGDPTANTAVLGYTEPITAPRGSSKSYADGYIMGAKFGCWSIPGDKAAGAAQPTCVAVNPLSKTNTAASLCTTIERSQPNAAYFIPPDDDLHEWLAGCEGALANTVFSKD